MKLETSPEMQRQRTRARPQPAPQETLLWLGALAGIGGGLLLAWVAAGDSDAILPTLIAGPVIILGALFAVGALILGGIRHLSQR